MTTIDSAVMHLMADGVWSEEWNSPCSVRLNFPSNRLEYIEWIVSMSIEPITTIVCIEDGTPLSDLCNALSTFPEGIYFPRCKVTAMFRASNQMG